MNDDNNKIEEPSGAYFVAKNRLQASDAAIHSWYRFVLGYPPHLVTEYLNILEADPDRDWVFDPFCGTATTPVEARLKGYSTISADANPISILAAKVKLNWNINVDDLERVLTDVLEIAIECLQRYNISFVPDQDIQLSLFTPRIFGQKADGVEIATGFDPDLLLPEKTASLIPNGFISPKPLLRVLALRYAIENIGIRQDQQDFLKLALASTIIKSAGNVGFGPEVYRLPPREDADVLTNFFDTVLRMIADLGSVIQNHDNTIPTAFIFQDDARTLARIKNCPPIGIVITSPPYPNEKDYTRSTRLESVLLGLINGKDDLRKLKSNLLRSNTRNVFVGDNDDVYVNDIPSISNLADEIEQTRIKLGKTSGFERLYHRVTRLYFGGMYRHLASLYPMLRSGARLAYVVGDQMSYFRIPIHTARLLADVGVKIGYKVDGINLWRTRRSTITGIDLEENILLLKR